MGAGASTSDIEKGLVDASEAELEAAAAGLSVEDRAKILGALEAEASHTAPPDMKTALLKLQLPNDITTATVEEILQVCKKHAMEINTPMNIAVCDAEKNLKGFLRMDGAWLGSIDIAQKKAYTARNFNMDTRDIGPLCQPGQPLYGIEHSNQGLITFGGGVLLKNAAGTVIGAIGVSGGSVEQDHDVAAVGVACAKK